MGYSHLKIFAQVYHLTHSEYSVLGSQTLSCLVISLTRVIWNFDAFKNNSGINHKFTKYVESFRLNFDKYFSFEYFQKMSFCYFLTCCHFSFPVCYEHEFTRLHVLAEGGVPLEHLITCIPGIQISLSKAGIKKVQWAENRPPASLGE